MQRALAYAPPVGVSSSVDQSEGRQLELSVGFEHGMCLSVAS